MRHDLGAHDDVDCKDLGLCAHVRVHVGAHILGRSGAARRGRARWELPFELWTRPAIRELVRVKFGVALSVRAVGDYCAR